MFGKNYFHLSLLVLLAACGEKEPTVPPAKTSGNQSAVVSDVTGNVNIQYKDERAATDVPAENVGTNGDQSPIINQVSGDASVQYVTNFYGANAEEVKHLQDDLKLSKQAAEALLKNLADKDVAVNSRTQEFERLARKYADLQRALGEVDTSDALSHQAQAALQAGDLDKAEKLLESAYQRDQQQADKRLGQHTLLLAQLSALKLENSKSIERYQQAVALQPDNRQAWAELALLAERVGDITLAVSAWQQVRKQTSISNAPADYLNALLHEGKVLGSSGDSTGALANYQLAQQTAQQLLAESPQNSAWQHSLAQSYLYSGHIQRTNGDMPAAQTAYQHSVELIEKLAQAEPNNRQWQRELLPAYSAVADLQREQGNAPAAIDSYNKALKIAQDKLQLGKQQADALLKNLADKNVDLARRTEAFSQLAQTYVALQARLGSYAATDELAQQARKALQTGHLDVAETLLERVYARDQKLADQQLAQRAFALAEISELKLDYPKATARYQEVTQRQPDNFTAWQNLALLAQKQGNTSQALQAWQQLQQNVSQTLEPAVYVTALLGEGDILFLQERNVEALKVYQSAVTASRTWHDKQPEKGSASELLASSLLSLGKLQFPGDSKQALATVEESIKWHTTLQQQSPDDVQRQRDLAVALSSAGELYRSHGDLNAAQRAHQDALKWREKLLASAKDNLQWQRDVFVSVSNIALVEGALGNDAAVLPLLQRADALSQQLTQRDPHNREWQRDRSILLERLATAYTTKDDQSAALKAQREAWDITQTLAKLDPDNQQWQRDFVTTGETLREFYQASDDNKALGTLLAAVIPVQKRLVDLEPDNLEQKTALYLNYGRLGETHQLQNDNRAALQAYQQALELNQQLAAAKPDVSAFRGEIATNLNRIGAAHFALKDNAKLITRRILTAQLRQHWRSIRSYPAPNKECLRSLLNQHP